MIKRSSIIAYSAERTDTVDFWRERFTVIKQKARGSGKVVIRLLAIADPYYDSITGLSEFKNVDRGKASLIKTKKAVLLLENVLDTTNEKRKKYLKKITQ